MNVRRGSIRAGLRVAVPVRRLAGSRDSPGFSCPCDPGATCRKFPYRGLSGTRSARLGIDSTRTRDLRRDRPLLGSRGGRRSTRDRSVHVVLRGPLRGLRRAEQCAARRLLPVCCPTPKGGRPRPPADFAVRGRAGKRVTWTRSTRPSSCSQRRTPVAWPTSIRWPSGSRM